MIQILSYELGKEMNLCAQKMVISVFFMLLAYHKCKINAFEGRGYNFRSTYKIDRGAVPFWPGSGSS